MPLPREFIFKQKCQQLRRHAKESLNLLWARLDCTSKLQERLSSLQGDDAQQQQAAGAALMASVQVLSAAAGVSAPSWPAADLPASLLRSPLPQGQRLMSPHTPKSVREAPARWGYPTGTGSNQTQPCPQNAPLVCDR